MPLPKAFIAEIFNLRNVFPPQSVVTQWCCCEATLQSERGSRNLRRDDSIVLLLVISLNCGF